MKFQGSAEMQKTSGTQLIFSNETFISNIVISIFAELAAEEKRTLSERIKSGLVNARHKGRRLGRPHGKQDDEALLKKYSRLATDLKKGLSLSQCEKLHQVSRPTAIKIRKLCMAQIPS